MRLTKIVFASFFFFVALSNASADIEIPGVAKSTGKPATLKIWMDPRIDLLMRAELVDAATGASLASAEMNFDEWDDSFTAIVVKHFQSTPGAISDEVAGAFTASVLVWVESKAKKATLGHVKHEFADWVREDAETFDDTPAERRIRMAAMKGINNNCLGFLLTAFPTIAAAMDVPMLNPQATKPTAPAGTAPLTATPKPAPIANPPVAPAEPKNPRHLEIPKHVKPLDPNSSSGSIDDLK
jgi:hypothetical protein